jgi:DNA-binding XRE family transcriptional regulator
MSAFIKITHAEPLPGHRIDLRFSDGSAGIVDLSDLPASRAVFAPLANANVFEGCVIENGTLEWPGTDLGLAVEFLYARANGLPEPRTEADATANELAVSLRQLRKLAGKTQTELAETAGVTQATVAGIEARDDHKLSALRKYVQSLGGTLEIVAEINGVRYTLHGV